MRSNALILVLLLLSSSLMAQKKPLDHSVYDQWQSIGERLLSADGNWLAYTVNVQEGDGELVIQSSKDARKWRVPRAYQAAFSHNNRFLVARIKPFFSELRKAKIAKKGPNETPRDSLYILELDKGYEQRIPDVKSFQLPEKAGNILAYHLWKPAALPKENAVDSLTRLQDLLRRADSLNLVADSLRNRANEARIKGMQSLQPARGGATKPKRETVDEGTELVVRDLTTGKEWRHKLVVEYKLADYGQAAVIELSKKNSDTLSEASLVWLDFLTGKADTIYRVFQEAKLFTFADAGDQLAFVVQKDSAAKALRKYYQLYHYTRGTSKATALLNSTMADLGKGKVISPDFSLYFSKDGKRLFFGLAPDRPVKDTSLVDFETAKLDVWNYQDDYLQPQQLVTLATDLKKSWLSVWDLEKKQFIQLADDSCEIVLPADEGNGQYAVGMSSAGLRIEQQWKMDGAVRVFRVDTRTGQRVQISARASRSSVRISPAGKYIVWYDALQKQWISYSCITGTSTVATRAIKFPLFDEEHDTPSDAPPHGIMAWKKDDEKLYVYDKYDVWEVDPAGKQPPVMLTNGWGRKNKVTVRNEQLDRDQRFIATGQTLLFQLFDHASKGYGWMPYVTGTAFTNQPAGSMIHPFIVDGAVKAKTSEDLLFIQQSPAALNLYAGRLTTLGDTATYRPVSSLNPQQEQYNWFTVELHKWKMLDGKTSEGLLYKPENFDPSKKYPVIFYFYEKNADRRYNYIEPMPVRASVNIAYYTSNGYLVFDPNIYYKTGQPGEDAYNSVVSAANYLSRFRFVDSTKMGLQGHSWGGYQIAYLITRTNKFAAAEAGAPVSNMTSAYGGIRWGTGISRQFQYEKTQSRIGASLWEKPTLYIKNSPLFRADKVKTPLLMLHNDKDDAVPWYQGIEYFTALRRLGKPVWMINYNDELHGIIERRNRKDWTIRLAQFFDHYLKGQPAPKWMKEGVPATLKGIDWGLGY